VGQAVPRSDATRATQGSVQRRAWCEQVLKHTAVVPSRAGQGRAAEVTALRPNDPGQELDHSGTGVVGSDGGAVLVLRSVCFPGPPAAPGVR
jgi:hypothetical protein